MFAERWWTSQLIWKKRGCECRRHEHQSAMGMRKCCLWRGAPLRSSMHLK